MNLLQYQQQQGTYINNQQQYSINTGFSFGFLPFCFIRNDFSDYESENSAVIYGDSDGEDDVLMEVEALHNEVIGDLEPF